MSSARPARSRSRTRPYLIERRDQLTALESSVRQEIIDTLQAAGPRSALEIASLMGRPADALYYHIRKLEAVGLLVERETRRRGRRDEAVYDLVGRPLLLRYPAHSGSRRHPLLRLVRSMLRTAERDFGTAVAGGTSVTEGPGRNLWAGRRHAWLTATELRRVNRHMAELVATLTRAREPGRGQLCTVTMVLAPRAARQVRRNGSADRGGTS